MKIITEKKLMEHAIIAAKKAGYIIESVKSFSLSAKDKGRLQYSNKNYKIILEMFDYKYEEETSTAFDGIKYILGNAEITLDNKKYTVVVVRSISKTNLVSDFLDFRQNMKFEHGEKYDVIVNNVFGGTSDIPDYHATLKVGQNSSSTQYKFEDFLKIFLEVQKKHNKSWKIEKINKKINTTGMTNIQKTATEKDAMTAYRMELQRNMKITVENSLASIDSREKAYALAEKMVNDYCS